MMPVPALRRSLLLCLTALCLSGALPTRALAVSQDASVIPQVTGNTLAGTHVDLPGDLRGRPAILVLGFAKEARLPVRDWGKRLATDFFSSPSVLYYEMPVVAGVPRLLRGFVLKSIASEVSERGKQHFLAITDNEARWRALAQVKDPDAAYILVVDATGHVRWQTSGPLTEAAYAALRAHLPLSP